MKSDHQLSKPLFYASFVLSIITCLLAVTIVILLAAFGYAEFGDGTPISADCSNYSQTSYFSAKFGQPTVIVKNAFIMAVFSALCSIVLVVVMTLLFCKIIKEETIRLQGIIKILLYCSSSIMVLLAIIPAGQYLVFYHELGTCQSISHNQTRVLVIAILGIILVVLGLILWALLLPSYYQEASSQQKYREVIATHQTQPYEQDNTNQKKNPYQQSKEHETKPVYQTKKPQERPYQQQQQQHYIMQETRQNLHQSSPNKKPVTYTYSKDPRQPSNEEMHSISKYQSKKKQTMPLYEPKNSRYNENGSRYTPQRSNVKETNNDEQLVYHRQKRSPEYSNFDNALFKQSRQYLNRHGGRPILNHESNFEERTGKGSEQFRSREAQRERSPPSRPQRQGVLLNYIRGKYAG